MAVVRKRVALVLTACIGAGGLGAACNSLVAVPIDDDLPEAGAEGAASDATVAESGSNDGSTIDSASDAPVDSPSEAALDGGADADADADADAEVEKKVRFAIVGDFGTNSARELAVANLIMTWNPEFVVTVGDNDYAGPVHQYDQNVGQYYHSFIAPYAGAYGAGAVENAFFPAMGNHDLDFDDGAAYFDFLTLPNNERYYEVDKGFVHLVVVDSDVREPDGVDPLSTQGVWAQTALGASVAPFKLVVFHHPAYTSGGRSAWMDWPFKDWGATAVVTGHVHNYERLRSADGLSYFVIGQGGNSSEGFGAIHPSSQLRYNARDGAQLVEVSATVAHFRYFNVDGNLVDQLKLDPAGNVVP